MSADRDSVYNIYPEELAVPAGSTMHAFPALSGQIGVILKYISGGTLIVIGTSTSIGSTYAINQRYIVGTSEILNIAQSGTLFLQATGSTAVVQMLRLRSAGATFTI